MKIDYPKEWFVHSAKIEGDVEVGAGVPPTSRILDMSDEEDSMLKGDYSSFVLNPAVLKQLTGIDIYKTRKVLAKCA
ncbi:MAG: hypothetical protein K9M54_03490 [Kiritimatiellales bacterium]|nr:hypothetical protein [Kiritimatiellales bacterium]